MRFVFFRTPAARPFTYTPIYYDEQKERMENRLQGAAVSDSPAYRDALRSRLSQSWKRRQQTPERRYSVIRPVVVLIIATILIFIFLEHLTAFISTL